MTRSSPKDAAASRRAAARAAAESLRAEDRPHALAATARSGLDEDWIADAFRGAGQAPVVLGVAVVSRDGRDAELASETSGCRLVAHRPDRRGRRTDPAQPGGADGGREVGVLGEEAEAGVDGVGSGSQRRGDHCGTVEEVDGAGAVRVGHDRGDPEESGRFRVILAAISPRFAMKIRPMVANSRRPRAGPRASPWNGPVLGADRRASPANAPAPLANASNASDATRQRAPTRRAGSRPAAIQR